MIQSLTRAFKMLELLDSELYREEGLGASELSKQMKLKFPTTHNFLKSLVGLGYVEQLNDSGKYRLGQNAYNLGRIHNNQKELLDITVPLIEEINRKFNETIIVVTYENYLRNVIYQAECRQSLKVSLQLGTDNHFYKTSTGHSLLINLDKSEFNQLIKKLPLNSKTEEKKLIKQLEKVKQQGYEVIEKTDVTVIGVPLFYPEKKLIAALGAFFPTVRYNIKLKEDLVKALLETSKKVIQRLQ